MELQHYTNNEDVKSISEKSDNNFRRLAVQITQKLSPMLRDIEDLKKRMKKAEERLDKLEERMDEAERRLDDIEERLDDIEEKLENIPPVGSFAMFDSNTYPSTLYPDMGWSWMDSFTTNGGNNYNIYKRTY